MIRLGLGWFFAAIVSIFIFWRESGENTAVFCYRMGSGLYLGARTGAWRRDRALPGEFAACSNPYDTCSTPSMTLKD